MNVFVLSNIFTYHSILFIISKRELHSLPFLHLWLFESLALIRVIQFFALFPIAFLNEPDFSIRLFILNLFWLSQI
jgi:hypothetical protein